MIDHSLRRIPAHLGRFRVLYAMGLAWALMAMALPSLEPEQSSRIGGSALLPDAGDPLATADDGGDPSAAAEGGAGGEDVAAGSTAGSSTSAAGVSVPGSTSVGPTATIGEPGVARSGVECVPGARQIPDSSYAPPCQQRYAGPTPRNLSPGVSSTTIRIVHRTFPSSATNQLADSLGAGIPEDEVRANEEMFAALFDYLNENFELYGRKVELIDYPSRHGDPEAELVGGGREGACADAAFIAEELGAFGVVELSPRVPFERCAAERGLVVFNANSFASAEFYEQHHPLLWATAPDCSRTTHQLADYAKARLIGRKAIHAGDPALRRAERVLGVYVPDLDEYQRCIGVLSDRLRVETGTRLVVYTYRAEAARLVDQAQRAILHFRQNGVTSIVLTTDYLSPLFLTQAASQLGYRPEWIASGAGGGEDIAANARLYDASQIDGHFFGRSLKASDRDIFGPDSEPGRVYKQATGREAHPNGQGNYFGLLLPMFSLLQVGGPDLTPESIASGVFALPSATGPVGRFGVTTRSDGGPGHDHTLIDDAVEIYWDPDVVDHFGQKGDFVATMGGRRFSHGDWPSGDPVLSPG